MPHDKNRTEIKEGDIVYLPCRVERVYATQDGLYCNCDLATLIPMPPYESGTHIVVNASQVVLVERGK